MPHKRWLSLVVVLICAVLTLSCVTPCFSRLAARSSVETVPAPQPTLPPSEEAARSFEEKAKALQGVTFEVEFTEQEVTSYMALRAASSGPIASPRISFQPGQVTLEGDLTGPIPGRVTLRGTLQAVDGKPQLQFQEASVAGVPIPAVMLASLSDSLSQMIAESEGEVEVERIDVLDGRIVIAGRSVGS